MKKIEVRQERISIRTLSTILLTSGLLIIYFIPTNFSLQVVCIHRQLMGFDCPGCGMTRALHSFLHLDIAQAIHHNFAIIGLVSYILAVLLLAFRPSDTYLKFKKLTSILLTVLLVAVYTIRTFQHFNNF